MTRLSQWNWIDQVDGLLEMHFPGQEGGVATAEILTGEVNPSGKLAYAIPKTDKDTMVTCSQEAFDALKISSWKSDSEEDYQKKSKWESR